MPRREDFQQFFSSPGLGAFCGAATRLAAVGLTYFLLAKLGLRLASLNPSASPVWPPTGFAIAAVLLWGNRLWPALLLAAFFANVTTAGSLYTSLAIASGNTLEALIAGYLTTRYCGGLHAFDTPADIAKFGLISLGPATLTSATIGAGSLYVGGYVPAGDLASVGMTWWTGNLAGALLLTPVIVLWARPPFEPLSREDLARTGVVVAVACVVGVVAFSPIVASAGQRGPLGFLAIGPLLLAALYRGPRETATVALVLSGFAVWGTAAGDGFFARPTLNDSFLLVTMFVIGAALPSLALSAEVARRKEAEERQGVLIAELDHRVKNILASISAIAKLSSRGAKSIDAFTKALDGRIQAMSVAHALVRSSPREGTSMADLVGTVLAPCGAPGSLRISGEPIALDRKAAHTLALALHELATNAMKYGALSVPGGRITIAWRRKNTSQGRPAVQLVWSESGGPPVEPAPAKGFGLTVLQDMVAHELGAEVRCEFAPAGLVCTIEGPFGSHAGETSAVPMPRSRPPATLLGHPVEHRRILIVEDEAPLAISVKALLESDGHCVVGPAASVEAALALVDREKIDAAILDFRLMEADSTAVAERLHERGIPFAFATGYDELALPSHLRAAPRLGKPYLDGDIRTLVARLVA